jgi:hypothetical protein
VSSSQTRYLQCRDEKVGSLCALDVERINLVLRAYSGTIVTARMVVGVNISGDSSL